MSSSGTPETKGPIEKFLDKVFPGNEILCERTVKQLEELGVNDVHDIQYLKETDLIPHLKPIQARKLLSKVQDMDFTRQSRACTPNLFSPPSMESLSAESGLEQGSRSDWELNVFSVKYAEQQAGGSSKER